MSLSLAATAPCLSLEVTPSSIFLELGGFSLFVNLWDTYKGKPGCAFKKHEGETGGTLHLGPITAEAAWTTAPAPLPIKAAI